MLDTFLTVAQEGTEACKETEALKFWQHSVNCLPLINNWHNFQLFTPLQMLLLGSWPHPNQVRSKISWWFQLVKGSGGWRWISGCCSTLGRTRSSSLSKNPLWVKGSVWSLKVFLCILILGIDALHENLLPALLHRLPLLIFHTRENELHATWQLCGSGLEGWRVCIQANQYLPEGLKQLYHSLPPL